MKIKQYNNVLWLLIIVLLSIIKSTHQTVYNCDTTASCGCSSQPVSISRIVGGEDASAATWGWAVSISIAGTYLCGGSIISSQWIITAAHCVTGYRASQITIYAGSIRPYVGTQIRVGSVLIVHPAYNRYTYENDIALLKLTSPLDMSDPNVDMICLPSVSSSILAAGEWPPVNTPVVAVGWGRLTEGGSLPTYLQQVTVQTVAYNAATCTPSMSDWHVQFCAGVSGGGKDTCQGDSGGPLMMYASSQQWILVGLTSNGIGCAEANYSGVYTRVAAFQDWIMSNTNDSISITVSIATSTTVQTTVSITSSTSSTSTKASVGVSYRKTIGTSIFRMFIFILLHLSIISFY